MAEPISLINRFDFRHQVLNSNGPVAVLFTGADHESKKIDRLFAGLSDEYDGRMRFVSVDATLADLLDVDHHIRPRNTPTVLLFHGGEELKRWGNEQNPDEYREAFDELLENTM